MRFLIVDCPAVWRCEDEEADIRPFCEDRGRMKRVIVASKGMISIGEEMLECRAMWLVLLLYERFAKIMHVSAHV